MTKVYGTKPIGYKTYTTGNIDVKKGDIYGAKIQFTGHSYLPKEYFEEQLLKEFIDKIKREGDKPIYIKVNAEDIGTSGGLVPATIYRVTVEMFIQKQSGGTFIVNLIIALALLVFSSAYFISKYADLKYLEYYYKSYGKPPEKEKEGLLSGLGTLLLLIIILYALSKRG